jgi:hypothetical protein
MNESTLYSEYERSQTYHFTFPKGTGAKHKDTAHDRDRQHERTANLTETNTRTCT